MSISRVKTRFKSHTPISLIVATSASIADKQNAGSTWLVMWLDPNPMEWLSSHGRSESTYSWSTGAPSWAMSSPSPQPRTPYTWQSSSSSCPPDPWIPTALLRSHFPEPVNLVAPCSCYWKCSFCRSRCRMGGDLIRTLPWRWSESMAQGKGRVGEGGRRHGGCI